MGGAFDKPAVPKRFDVDDTGKLALSAVCVPVSPATVTLDPVGKSMLAVSVTDTVTVAPATGVLCPMREALKDGTITFIGLPPSATP